MSIILIFSCQKQSEPQKPNIIFILADDLGYGDLGCFGQDSIQTPMLDKMAQEGIKFTQHYAGNTVCAPSRCTLMTVLHTGHSRIRGNGGGVLKPKDTTVAELLKSGGYKTGLIGKWGLGNEKSTGHPNKKGFDYFIGYLNQVKAHNYYPEYLWKNTEKVFLNNEVIHAKDVNAKGVGGASSKKVDYSHDFFTKEALNFITESKDNWKGLRRNLKKDANAPLELFDLEVDIAEQKDMAEDNSRMVKTIEKLMKEAHTPSEIFPMPGEK